MKHALYWTHDNVEAIQRSGAQYVIFRDLPDDNTLALLASTTNSSFVLFDQVVGLSRLEKGAAALTMAQEHANIWKQWYAEANERIGLNMPDPTRLYFQGNVIAPTAYITADEYTSRWRQEAVTNTGSLRVYYMQYLSYLAYAGLRGAIVLGKGTPFKPLENMQPNWTFLSGLDAAMRTGKHITFMPDPDQERIDSMPWQDPFIIVDGNVEPKGENMFRTTDEPTGGDTQGEQEADLAGFQYSFTSRQMASVNDQRVLALQIASEAQKYEITQPVAFAVHDSMKTHGISPTEMPIKFRVLKFKDLLGQPMLFAQYFTDNDNEEGIMVRTNPGGNFEKVHQGQKGELLAFEVAKRLSSEAAYASLIIGEYSIYAEDHSRAGYESAEAMHQGFKRSADSRIVGFFHYLASDRHVLAAMRARDWQKFATRVVRQQAQANILQQRLTNAMAHLS